MRILCSQFRKHGTHEAKLEQPATHMDDKCLAHAAQSHGSALVLGRILSHWKALKLKLATCSAGVAIPVGTIHLGCCTAKQLGSSNWACSSLVRSGHCPSPKTRLQGIVRTQKGTIGILHKVRSCNLETALSKRHVLIVLLGTCSSRSPKGGHPVCVSLNCQPGLSASCSLDPWACLRMVR